MWALRGLKIKDFIGMGYAVLHHEKGKDSGANHGNHIDRNERGKNSFQHANPKLRDYNVNFECEHNRHEMPISEAIKDRIEKGYKGKRKVRNDAVKYVKTVLTGSHDEMKEIFKDKDKAQDWIKANRKFIENEFGKENIVRFTLHMDERTPHIHVVSVPLTKDGRLSAKEVMGNKDKLQDRQDRYAELMKPFNLQRGEKNTGIKHEDAKEYYKRIKIANKIQDTNVLEAKRSVLSVDFGLDKDKTIENYKIVLASKLTALNEKEHELKQAKKQLGEVKKSADFEKRRYKEVMKREEFYNESQKKYIEYVQKHLKNSIREEKHKHVGFYRKPKEERDQLIRNAAIREANKLKIGQEMFDKAMNGDDFFNKERLEIDLRAEETRQNDEYRNHSRGFSR